MAWCVFAELNAVDFGDYLESTPHFSKHKALSHLTPLVNKNLFATRLPVWKVFQVPSP